MNQNDFNDGCSDFWLQQTKYFKIYSKFLYNIWNLIMKILEVYTIEFIITERAPFIPEYIRMNVQQC